MESLTALTYFVVFSVIFYSLGRLTEAYSYYESPLLDVMSKLIAILGGIIISELVIAIVTMCTTNTL